MSGPVTEFAILRLKPAATSLADPELNAGLRRVSAEQSAWSSFPLHWFTYSTDKDTFVCILSNWESVSAHQDWISSPQNQALLQLLLPKLEIFAFCHVDLRVSRADVELDEVLQAQRVSWRVLGVQERAAGTDAHKGDACGWAEDTPEPTFYVFRIDVEGDGTEVENRNRAGEGGDWTTMFRLDFENL